jgi:hypothetical protein
LNEISDSEDLLTRFLLGEATERERAEVEDRLLTDDGFYARLLAAESDLMDAYVRSELPHRERLQFEKIFFSSVGQRERVEFARGLAQSTTRAHQKESAKSREVAQRLAQSSLRKGLLASLFATRPGLSYAVAAAAVAVVGIAVWFAVERMRARVELQQVRTEGVAPERPVERPRASGGETPAVVSTPEHELKRQTPPAVPVFATITLAPGSLRDGAAGGNLIIARGATYVRLLLQLEEDNYQSYRANVSTPEGQKVWTGAARKDRVRDAQSVTLTLPAASLKRGDYVVELSGAVAGARSQPAAHYSFRVTRED